MSEKSYPKYSKDCGFTASIQYDKGVGIKEVQPGQFVKDDQATQKGWTVVGQYEKKGYKDKWTPICKRPLPFSSLFYDRMDNFNEKEIDYKGTGKKRKSKKRSKKNLRSKRSCKK